MKPPTDVLVLLSGGQDSTTCLFWAREQYPEARLHALTVAYGQRHDNEVKAAADIAELAGCASHRIVDLFDAFGRSDSALLIRNNVEIAAAGGLADHAAPNGLPTSFVPGRNLVFLAVAASCAVAAGASVVVTGVCQTDYSGYPDCRLPFVSAMERAINEALPSSLRPFVVKAPLMDLSKADTVALMWGFAHRELGRSGKPGSARETSAWRALGLTVTCYRGDRPGCGVCPACKLRDKGFSDAGVVDPATDPAVSS